VTASIDTYLLRQGTQLAIAHQGKDIQLLEGMPVTVELKLVLEAKGNRLHQTYLPIQQLIQTSRMNAKQSQYHQIQLQKILVDSPIGAILPAIALLNLPDWWLAGGAVRNTVWRSLFGNDCQLIINDFDIALLNYECNRHATECIFKLQGRVHR
jgi:hypothetical protein